MSAQTIIQFNILIRRMEGLRASVASTENNSNPEPVLITSDFSALYSSSPTSTVKLIGRDISFPIHRSSIGRHAAIAGGTRFGVYRRAIIDRSC